MTLKEAAGVDAFCKDIKTGKLLTHSEVYGRIIDFLGGLDAVAPYIPFPIEAIKEALKTDPNLNNLALRKWDEASGFEPRPVCNAFRQQYQAPAPTYRNIWTLYRVHGITCASVSDGVCILKEAAIRLAKRKES